MKQFILDNIVYLIYVIFVTLSLIVTFIKYLVDRKKAKTKEEKERVRLTLINTLKKQIDGLIADAEQLKNFKPEEKKAYVMTRAIQLANGLMTNEEIDEYIESQVKLTDIVNKHY